MNAPRPEPAPKETWPRRRPSLAVALEGDDDLYSQTWWPVCESAALGVGDVVGAALMGGRVVAYRGADGVARVVSGYCVHMGADLSLARVIGDRLQCAFHRWEFGAKGLCVATPTGHLPRAGTGIFAFPTCEWLGLVWAFNGERPLWTLPALDVPEATLLAGTRPCGIVRGDPRLITANAFDWQHFETVHRLGPGEPLTPDDIDWQPFSCGYAFRGRHWQGEAVDFRFRVIGTNIFVQQGTLEGHWYALLIAAAAEAPGRVRSYLRVFVPDGDGSEAATTEARHRLEARLDLEERFNDEDVPILNTIHFRPGALLPEDRPLIQYLAYLNAYPRAHPSRQFLD